MTAPETQRLRVKIPAAFHERDDAKAGMVIALNVAIVLGSGLLASLVNT